MIALELIPRPLLVAVIAALFVTNGVTAYRGVAATTAAAKSATDLADLKTAYSRAISDAQIALSAKAAEYRDREQSLRASATTERKTYEKKLAAATSVADDLRLRLENTAFGALHTPTAAEAATTAGANTAAGGSDGAELRRPFGLVDEALRAEKVRLGLLGCYRQYDEATSALK